MKGDKIVKIAIGILFIIFGVRLIAGTNNTSDNNNTAISEASTAIDVASDVADATNDGKIVATTGKINYNDVAVMDSLTGFVLNTPLLKRKVELYQWQRDCGESGDNCKYNKVWAAELIDSSDYDEGHQNPETIPYKSESLIDEDVRIGAFGLDAKIIEALPVVTYEEKMTNDASAADGQAVPFDVDEFYYIDYATKPELGNVRISYEYTKAETVSVLALQKDSKLVPYVSSEDKEFFKVHEGEHKASELLQYAKNNNNISHATMWILALALVGVGVLFIFDTLKKK